MDYLISKLKKSDTALIRNLIGGFLDSDKKPSLEHFLEMLTDDRTYLFTAQIQGEVIGYVLAYRFPSIYSDNYLAYLYDIEVLPKHRKKGVGRKLVEALLDILKMDNVSELWLGTATDNHAGQALFSKTGGIKSIETFNDYTYEL